MIKTKKEKSKDSKINYTDNYYDNIVGWYRGEKTHCGFDEIKFSKLGECLDLCKSYKTLNEAMRICCSIPECYGVTYSNEKFGFWGY